jgi:tRNA-specific 2-thiouridylase
MNIPNSLKKNRVVIALSGGVDSSVAAVLLKEAGYEVIGITLKLWDPPQEDAYRHTSCCSVEDIGDARRVAEQIGIPFYVVNSKEHFRKNVVDRFVQEYLQGRTPNPCALCNDKVKFSFLLEKAFELEAYYVATGHYAQKHWNEAKQCWELFKGRDASKDQSYFLFSLGQSQLEHILFPVGELSKERVREIARGHGLKTTDKPESQEICFVPGNHADFIKKYSPETVGPPGEILNEGGEVLGTHQGIYRYTVGQRRGTHVALGDRSYVKSIDARSNTITLGTNESLLAQGLWAQDVRWVHDVVDGMEVTARIRYRHGGSPAVLHLEKNGGVRLQFREPQRAISPGQAVVFYQGDQVLGGGWIEREER